MFAAKAAGLKDGHDAPFARQNDPVGNDNGGAIAGTAVYRSLSEISPQS